MIFLPIFDPTGDAKGLKAVPKNDAIFRSLLSHRANWKNDS